MKDVNIKANVAIDKCSYYYLKFLALVKVVGRRSSFQGGERYVSASEGRNIWEFWCAKSAFFIVSSNKIAIGKPVSVTTSRTAISNKRTCDLKILAILESSSDQPVKLVGQPRPIFWRSFIEGETFWARRLKFDTDVRNIKSFSCS